MPVPPRRFRPAILIPFVAVLGLAACGSDPWVDSRREAGNVNPVGQSKPDRPAICYAPWSVKPGEVLALAQEVCGQTGRRAVYIGTEKWQCRLATPHRAFFQCE